LNYEPSHKEMIDIFEQIKAGVQNQFGEISLDQSNNKSAPEKWSAAECIEHLNITASGYLNNVPKNLRDNSTTFISSEKYKPRFLLKKFALLTGPDSKTKMPSPKFLQTKDSSLDKNVVTRFIQIQNEFISILNQINFVQLKKIKIKWPAAKFVNLQLGEVAVMVIAHELRHLKQAELAYKSG
jgi:hypothetical protein